MRDIITNMTKAEYSTLDWVLHNDGAVPADRFSTDPTVDGRVEQLQHYNFVTLDECGGLHITELGRAALVEYRVLKKEHFWNLFWKIIGFIITSVISAVIMTFAILTYFNK